MPKLKIHFPIRTREGETKICVNCHFYDITGRLPGPLYCHFHEQYFKNQGKAVWNRTCDFFKMRGQLELDEFSGKRLSGGKAR